jgi:predicted dehydrogenase
VSKLRLAVVGGGHLGRIHARLLAQRADVLLVGVADPLAEVRQQVAAECGAPTVADYRTLFEQADAAIIATPTRTHHAVALEFLNRGLHVLVEKPLATSVREADELVAAARHRGAILQVGHIERFNPALAAVRPHLAEPQFIEGVRAGAFTARSTDIGVVLDLMIHDIDLLLTLVGARVRNVLAMGRALLGRHEDVAHARFEFENDCVAQLSASRVHFGSARREMHVWTKRVMADIDFAARTVQLVTPSETVLRHEFDIETLSPAERLNVRDQLGQQHLVVSQPAVESRNAMVDQQQDFVDCIRTRRAPRVSGDDGRDALVIAERVLAAIAAHERSGGPTGPTHPILRGPHWQVTNEPARGRRAG